MGPYLEWFKTNACPRKKKKRFLKRKYASCVEASLYGEENIYQTLRATHKHTTCDQAGHVYTILGEIQNALKQALYLLQPHPLNKGD